MKEQLVLGDLNLLESLHDSKISTISIRENALVLQFDDIVPSTPELEEHQKSNGISRKLTVVYNFPFEPDFWTARAQLIYYKKKIFRPKVESITLTEFLELINNKITFPNKLIIEVLDQFFNNQWCVIEGILYGKQADDKTFLFADVRLLFRCDKIEYDWEIARKQ